MLIFANYKGLHKELKDINVLAKKATDGDYLLKISPSEIVMYAIEKPNNLFFIKINFIKEKWKALNGLSLDGIYQIDTEIMTKFLGEVTTTELMVGIEDNGDIVLKSAFSERTIKNINTLQSFDRAFNVIDSVIPTPIHDNIDCTSIDEIIKNKNAVYFPFKIGKFSILLSKNVVPYPLADSKGIVYPTANPNFFVFVIKLDTPKYSATQYIRFMPF